MRRRATDPKMGAVGATTAVCYRQEAVMALRNVRASVARLVLVAGVAVALAVGAFGVGGPSGAEAKPRRRETMMQIAWMHLAHAGVFYNLGMMEQYYYHLGKYEALSDTFYSCYQAGG
jgi:hypothetical protein